MPPNRSPQSEEPRADDSERPLRRLRRMVIRARTEVLLLASFALNLLLYRQADRAYRELKAVRLDPLGLKYSAFGPDQGDLSSAAVLFFGDSRAQQWPAPRIQGFHFINRGVGGQTTEQIRGRISAHLTALSPRVVVIQGGINDLTSIPLFPHLRDEIVAACKANLHEIVAGSGDRGATVILTTIFPTGKVTLDRRIYWSPEVDRAVIEVNEYLRSLASSDVIVFDSWKLLEDHGKLREDDSIDTVHLNPKGYSILNSELSVLLERISGKPGGQ